MNRTQLSIIMNIAFCVSITGYAFCFGANLIEDISWLKIWYYLSVSLFMFYIYMDFDTGFETPLHKRFFKYCLQSLLANFLIVLAYFVIIPFNLWTALVPWILYDCYIFTRSYVYLYGANKLKYFDEQL